MWYMKLNVATVIANGCDFLCILVEEVILYYDNYFPMFFSAIFLIKLELSIKHFS